VLFVELGSGALAGLIALLVTVIILALIASRMMRRDQRIRIARVGVFVQRERIDEVPHDLHAIDPLDAESELRAAPIPPPCPPPPLPRPKPENDETQTWPQREEGP
jgi:hypothetical protein